jgi:hypothetical protein
MTYRGSPTDSRQTINRRPATRGKDGDGPTAQAAGAPELVAISSSPEASQHMSLSRTFYLRQHHITPFVADLKKALAWARG